MNVDEAIEKVDWVKTDYIKPHQYFVKDHNPEAFNVIAAMIRKHGVTGEFLGRRYRYWFFNEFKYWNMGGFIINRTRVKGVAA